VAARIRIGSRASALALAQTAMVVRALQQVRPGLTCEVVTFATAGDRDREHPLPAIGGKGLFTAELERALRAGRIALAVHSLKDLPTAPAPGLVVAAVLERADPSDALVSRSRRPLAELPSHPAIGTSSARRAAQIAALRPDARLLALRGNVETRVRKALDADGPYDAIVLAAAGLARLDLGREIVERLGPDRFLPAPGQGAIAVQGRAGDSAVELAGLANHAPTLAAVTAERAFLAGLEAGCTAPVAALGRVDGDRLELHGLVASGDGRRVLRFRRAGSPADPEGVGRAMADEALRAGAAALMPDSGWRSAPADP
jgi:hydroxymethylbilane synthase